MVTMFNSLSDAELTKAYLACRRQVQERVFNVDMWIDKPLADKWEALQTEIEIRGMRII